MSCDTVYPRCDSLARLERWISSAVAVLQRDVAHKRLKLRERPKDTVCSAVRGGTDNAHVALRHRTRYSLTRFRS